MLVNNSLYAPIMGFGAIQIPLPPKGEADVLLKECDKYVGMSTVGFFGGHRRPLKRLKRLRKAPKMQVGDANVLLEYRHAIAFTRGQQDLSQIVGSREFRVGNGADIRRHIDPCRLGSCPSYWILGLLKPGYRLLIRPDSCIKVSVLALDIPDNQLTDARKLEQGLSGQVSVEIFGIEAQFEAISLGEDAGRSMSLEKCVD